MYRLKIIGTWIVTLTFFSAILCTVRGDSDLEKLRELMVKRQIESRGVNDERVLKAMRDVERHKFVPNQHITAAYEDHPLPIGYGQTISQPYIVALMTELCRLNGTEKVLEIGTGSGYQAAVLSHLAKEVYSIEIVEPLGKLAKKRMKEMGYHNVHVRIGDGYQGWPDISGIVVLVGVTSTITYFYFSREHEGVLGRSAKVGTYFLMVFFGATFGFTVMSRMSTFIGRMEFLLTDFIGLMN